MEPMQTDNGSTLSSLQTSSPPPPSLGRPHAESNSHHAVELLHSVPFSLTSEMSSAGDDVEEVGPQEDHVPDAFDAHHNYSLNTETADVTIETEVSSSGLSSFSSKQFSGNPTSFTELVHSVPTIPSHLCAEGSGSGPRPVGQESALVAFVNEEDTAIAAQFASPAVAVVADQDDDMADTGERTPSSCEGDGYVSPLPPSYSSRVDFGYPVILTDPIDVVVQERSLSWEWPPRFSGEHEYEDPSPFAIADDHGVAIKERVPETSSPCHFTTVGVHTSSGSGVAANAKDNDDVMQDEESVAYERPEHVHSPPLPDTSVAPCAAAVADHNGDAILEPESFQGERAEFVPYSPQPYTMTVGFDSRVNVADDDVVAIQEPEYSSKEIHRPFFTSPSSTIAVDFASPAAVAFDSNVARQERASFPVEAPADVPQPPLENPVADDYSSPLAVQNDEDVLVWEETVADETALPASVPHDDVVIVQEAMTVTMSSSVVVRDNDGTVVEDKMAVEFTSPAVGQNDNGMVVEDIIALESPSPVVTNDDVGVVEDGMAAEFASSEVVSNEDVVVLQDLCAVEFTSRDIFLDEDAMVVQATNEDGFGAPNLVRDDVVVMQEAVAVKPPSPAADRDDCVVGVEDTATVETTPDAVPGDTAVIGQDRVAVELASSAVAAVDDDVVVLQDSSQFARLGSLPSSPPGGTGVVVSSSAVAVEDNLVLQGRTSSSIARPQHESSFTPALVDDSNSAQYKEGFQCRATDDVSPGEHPVSISVPKVFEVPVGVEQVSNAADPSSEALEAAFPRESPSSPGAANHVSMNGPEGVSTFLEEADELDNDTFDERQPAKKAKTRGTIYSGTDAVAVVLGQTAEIVLVLAGMAQMRAGKVPTSYERELATSAYQKLGILVSQLAPNNLVAKESLERMIQDYSKKKVAQKKREDQAWLEAVKEAEALANVRSETLARAKAESAARAQAEVAARAQTEAAARAHAEAEELERRQQAAMKAAAGAAANGLSKGSFSSVGGSPSSSGQSAYRAPEVTQSPSFPTPAVHHNSQVEIGSPILSPIAKVSEIPCPVTPTEKSISVNGQSHAPISKPSLGRPPKVRNRVRKEPATVTIFTPEFLNEVQSQAPDPQKANVTHKQLCAGVQHFIREHVPPVSQNLQALPPTYISAPFPCQVCKLIAKDTGSVLVCDSCDEVSHVKCVQPPSSRGASKGDWNCPKCLTASRGGKCPSKYGPIRPGSPNSVKLWPPHDTSAGNPESIRSSTNASVREEAGSATAGLQIGPGPPKVQGKAGLEIDTRAHQSMDEPSTGNFGSSPHLIVHLVNEPSPRTSTPLSGSSNSLLQDENRAQFPSGMRGSSLVQKTSALELLTKEISTEDQTELVRQSPTTMIQIDSLKTVHTDKKSEGVLEKASTQSAAVVEDTVPEAKSRRASPAQIKKTEMRTQTNQSKKGNLESAVILPGKQADVPLPIVMEWVGESTRRAEGKVYYRACSVGGITFSVSDCALFRPETPDVPPYIARLQVLWEDIATGHKWVRVSWCYYPTDIPLAMGRPGTTAPDEVYESNHCDNNLVGSIQGPCFVLPPLKFMEEMERRRTLKKRGEPVDELPPIFLSRWMYDAPKGVFRPLQE